MANMDPKTVAAALSKRLAAHRVSDKAVQLLAKQVVHAKAKPIGIDICQFGICLDYWVPRNSLGELINRLEGDATLGGIKVFPKGIIDPDAFLVTVEHIVER
jgi:hypothetical protein